MSIVNTNTESSTKIIITGRNAINKNNRMRIKINDGCKLKIAGQVRIMGMSAVAERRAGEE